VNDRLESSFTDERHENHGLPSGRSNNHDQEKQDANEQQNIEEHVKPINDEQLDVSHPTQAND